MSNEEPNHKIYVIPYINKYFEGEDVSNYNYGDIKEYSKNGIDRWVVVNRWGGQLLLIPETPVEIIVESADDNISAKISDLFQKFSGVNINGYGNFLGYYGTTTDLQNLIPDFLSQQTEKIYFISENSCIMKQDYRLQLCGGASSYYYENGEFNSTYGTIYIDSNPYTLGYRPVIKLKVKKEIQDADKKEVSSKLQIGDNVKYEAKGYKNWKVLSIDEDLGTVDIISGGIVKNLTLSGKDDWDNYENIIQREVDEYKNGSQTIRASIAVSSNLSQLKEIDKSILSCYLLLQKSKYESEKSYEYYTYRGNLYYYSISVVRPFKYINNYDYDLDTIVLNNTFYGDGEEIEYYKQLYYGEYTYTAGLRPIITLKLDSVEKLYEEESKKIEETTEKQEKIFIKEQESKNKNYKGPSKVDDSTSSTGNNNEVKSNDNDNTKENITDNNTSNVEKIVYKDKPFYKYGFIIATILCIIEPVITILIYKRIKER